MQLSEDEALKEERVRLRRRPCIGTPHHQELAVIVLQYIWRVFQLSTLCACTMWGQAALLVTDPLRADWTQQS